MEIFGAMIIPFFAAAVLLIFFQHKTKWWELAIPIVVSVVLCGGFKMMAEHSATRDSEFWGAWVTSSHYYEKWDEYIHQTCTRSVSCGKDCTTTETYDCSYVDYHAEYWSVKDSNGYEHNVTTGAFKHFGSLFAMTPVFVDMRRNYHHNDGDMYQVVWPKTDATIDPIVTTHTYENRVQASRSVFNYVAISRDDAQTSGLFDYPEISLFNTPSVLGKCPGDQAAADKRLAYYNGTLGREKQLRIWMLCFQGGDLQKGHLQEAYWVGGNKNEVVVAVGTNDDGTIGWVHPFSWTDNKQPIYEIRDFIAAQGSFDPVAAVEFIAPKLQESFERKHFEDFSYLTVEPPLWAVITTYVVMLLVNIGLGYFVVKNDFHEGKGSTKVSDMFRRRRGRY